MLQSRWLQRLYSLGLELWLPLPLLALVFWIGGGLLTDRILSHSYSTKRRIQADMQFEGKQTTTVLFIEVEIKRYQGSSIVKVKTANSALKELQFEFPFTELSQVEAAISQELGLSPYHVRKIVRYQIEDGN